MEITLVLNRSLRTSLTSFRTLLAKVSEKSAKKENLLLAPKNFSFQLLSDVKLKKQDIIMVREDGSSEEVDKGLDLSALPESVVEKITNLQQKNSFLAAQQEKRNQQLQELMNRVAQSNRDLNQKKNEVSRLMRIAEAQTDGAKKKIDELERQVAHLTGRLKGMAAGKGGEAGNGESAAKLEASVRAMESEKAQLNEKIAVEQKRVGMLEQKYSSLHRDLAAKERRSTS
jgi:hypothetical protein